MTRRFRISFFLAASLLAGSALAAEKADQKKGATPSPEPPPCSAAPYRQFDFWLGDWNVFDTAGKPAGHNHVVSVFGGCALAENWESEQGGRGTSLNVYDAVAGRWHQTWVDDHGGLLELNGGVEEGKLILVGSRPSVKEKGARIVHRITWTPLSADRVRQFWEVSKNEGRTWATLFDGTYVKKK